MRVEVLPLDYGCTLPGLPPKRQALVIAGGA